MREEFKLKSNGKLMLKNSKEITFFIILNLINGDFEKKFSVQDFLYETSHLSNLGFHYTMTPNCLYQRLFRLYKNGLLQREKINNYKIFYKLTEKGKKKINNIL